MTTTTATKAGRRPTLSLRPFDDRVVILPKAEEQAMRGGLHIPDSARERPTQGEVLAVGPGRWQDGIRVQMDVGVGDTVVLGGTCHAKLRLEGVIRAPEISVDGQLLTRGGRILLDE